MPSAATARRTIANDAAKLQHPILQISVLETILSQKRVAAPPRFDCDAALIIGASADARIADRIKPIFVNCLLCSHRLLLCGVRGCRAYLNHAEFSNHPGLRKAAFRRGACGAEHPANALADKLLHVVLYITLLSSFFVIIEPAPYEYLVAVLGFACVLARVSLPRLVLPLLVLLLIRDLGGAIGLLKILNSGWMRTPGRSNRSFETFDYPDSIRFLAISFYLGLSGVMFACIVSQDTTRRIATFAPPI